MKRYLANFENCLEREIPYCTGACPFQMDILSFMEKAARGSFKAAFQTYRNATGFPRIANLLCHAPCKEVCPRKDWGGSLELDLLEEAAIRLADTAPTDYNIPPKKERIAIVGAGLSGMAALLRLSTKKYTVEVFEKSDRVGGHLWDVMDPAVFEADFARQLAHQDYTLHLNREIRDLSELAGFDAVYVATGKNGPDWGLLDGADLSGPATSLTTSSTINPAARPTTNPTTSRAMDPTTNSAADPFCMERDGVGYFAGGHLIGDEGVHVLAEGLAMGTVIDNYLKTKQLYYPRGGSSSRMCAHMVTISADAPAIRPQNAEGYNKEEAMEEAARCVRCQCSACRDHCDLLAYVDKWPLKVKDEILATTLEGKSELKATPARRLMSMCNQCGICKEVCPEDIDLDSLFLAGRQKMHVQGKMPWPFHDFWLRDMTQANGPEAMLIRPPKALEYPGTDGIDAAPDGLNKVQAPAAPASPTAPTTPASPTTPAAPANASASTNPGAPATPANPTSPASAGTSTTSASPTAPPAEVSLAPACGYALFPGCQLGASEPEIVVKLYDALLNKQPDTAMFLRCCGVPLLWAGDREGFEKSLEEIRESWNRLGRPVMIMGCMTCMKHFKEFLPDLPVISLPEQLRRWDISGGCCEKTFCVFDPCSARSEEGARTAVRELAKDLGVEIEALPDNNEYFNCCGYGGHGEIANPQYIRFVTDRRVAEKDVPYITYCINCRDLFLKQGKDAHHILELLFGEGNGQQALPTVSERQENRRQLKQALLEFFWEEREEPMKEKQPTYHMTLEMSDEVRQKLNRERILEEQVLHTIDFCRRHRRTIYNEETDTYSGYCVIGHATYWVEYRTVDEAAGVFHLINAYTHRVKIELEAVWNGIKQETDLQ